jgi:protein-S-isoprenylcysteine O-methyltransferase Ste14
MLAPGLALASIVSPLRELPDAARALGLGLFGVGVLGTVWSQLAMGDSWRIGVDPAVHTGLVTGGPFRLVRNPIYSFTGLCQLSSALVVPSAVALIAPLLWIVAVEYQVRRIEEPYLIRTHGQSYCVWTKGVGRFVPGIGHGLGRRP